MVANVHSVSHIASGARDSPDRLAGLDNHCLVCDCLWSSMVVVSPAGPTPVAIAVH